MVKQRRRRAYEDVMPKKQRPYQYVLNQESQMVHRYPTFEQCNLDQVPRNRRSYRVAVAIASLEAVGWTRCAHCFPEDEC